MRSVALLGRAVSLLRVINGARLLPRGPSRKLPRHRAATCVTELHYGLLNGAINKQSICSYIAYVYASDSHLLSVHRCRPAC